VSLDERLVAVTKYDYLGLHLVNSLLERCGKSLRVAENVDHEDAQATELGGLYLLHTRWNIAFVDIAPNGCHGGNLFKLPKHSQVTNVSRVEDVAHAFEHAGNLGIKLPVCIGNDSDELSTHGFPFPLNHAFQGLCYTHAFQVEDPTWVRY
jgi:hypothetical protein